MSEVNPCTFKIACRNCNKAKLAERPEVCKAIECEDYNPCPGCGLNRNLLKSVNRGNLCKLCINPSKVNEVKSVAEGTKKLQESISTGNLGETELARMRGLRSITVPGTPPESLTDTEKAYYMQRWSEYEGYYRNPAAYYSVHQLILLEIHSDYINEKLTSARGEMQSELSREIQVIVRLKKDVNDTLPDKEAADVMDDEKSLSMIYESYMREKKHRTVGQVSRIFRRDTLALAPALHFAIDPQKLLERCGFKVVEIERLLPRIKELAADKSPEEILEYFGFKIDEEFAMSTEDRSLDMDDFDPEEELYGDPEQMETGPEVDGDDGRGYDVRPDPGI